MLKTASKAAPRTRPTSKKVASTKKKANQDLTGQRYIVIRNGRVIFKHESLSGAMDHRQTVPGSVIYGIMSDGDRVKSPRDEVRPNPLGRVPEDLSEFLEEDIAEVVSTALKQPNAIRDGLDRGGTVHDPQSIVSLKERSATNLECAIWHVELELEGRFDLRKPLPRQAATWLRGMAQRMTKAAAAVERLVDDRKRSIIRKLVHDESYLPAIQAEFMRFNYDGTLEKDQIAEYRATHEKGGAV